MRASLIGSVFFALIIVAIQPENTNAGVLSFINGILGGSDAMATEAPTPKKDNSQNIPLLEAALNTDPNPSKSTGDLAVVDNTALETTTGPNGTANEVEQKSQSADTVSIYTVRAGDSLSAIANMFGVSSNTILWANNLKSSKDIKEGDQLIILPISGLKYTVKKGDTLKSIAAKYHGDVDEIVTFNNLDTSVGLNVGDTIIIPDGDASDDSSNSQSGSKGSSKPTPAPSKSAVGYFIKPIKGIKTQGLHGKYRSAVDIGAPVGTPIYASATGRVIVAKMGGWNGGYGNYIVIQHSNGMQSLYAHLSEVDVSSGDSVKQGTFIAKSGNTGNSTGPHLHFELLGVRNWNPFN